MCLSHMLGADPDDPAFARHGGRNIGMTKWEGNDDGCLLRVFVDIRWLFPDPRSATAYHLATLQAKAEGKPHDATAKPVGDGCHVYSYPSGGALGAAQGIFNGALGDNHPFARGIERAIADMPDDSFIYLFTRGAVAVKFLAVLGPSMAARDGCRAAVHQLAERIVTRLDSAFPAGARKAAPWWRGFTGA